MLLSLPVDEYRQTQELGAIYRLPKTVVTLTISSYGEIRQERVKQDPGCNTSDASKACATDPVVVAVPKVILLDSVSSREIADSRTSFALQYDRSITSNDRVCMGVSPSGLLQSVEGAADDKTGDIIVAVAKLAGRLAGPGAFAAAVQAKTELYQQLRTMKIEIDPLDRSQWHDVRSAMVAQLGEIARDYSFEVDDIEHLVGTAPVESCPVNSICYRTRVPAQFKLRRNARNVSVPGQYGGYERQSGGVTSSVYADVVSRRVTGHVDVSRALMVERITKLSFNNGILVGVNIRKPSEGLAIAKLPLTVIDAVTTSALAAPGDFFAKFTGTNTALNNELIAKAATNEANVASIQKQLDIIRNADYTTSGFDRDSGETFQIKCATPAVAAAAAVVAAK